MKKRKKENDFIDDGRVIANMNIDGMRVPSSRELHLMSLVKQKKKRNQ